MKRMVRWSAPHPFSSSREVGGCFGGESPPAEDPKTSPAQNALSPPIPRRIGTSVVERNFPPPVGRHLGVRRLNRQGGRQRAIIVLRSAGPNREQPVATGSARRCVGGCRTSAIARAS